MKITTNDYTIELSIEEWIELSQLPKKLPINVTQVDSSHKPSIVKPIPISKELVLTDKNPHNKKVTNEQIRQIKAEAEKGLSNKDIATRLGIDRSLINYWRKNTPKGLYDGVNGMD